MMPNFIVICSIFFILNLDSQTVHNCLFTFSDVVPCSRNAYYSKLLARTSRFNTFSYLSTVRLNGLRRDNFGGSFSVQNTSPLIAGEITHKVWGFSLIIINTIHLEVKYIYNAVLAQCLYTDNDGLSYSQVQAMFVLNYRCCVDVTTFSMELLCGLNSVETLYNRELRSDAY